MGARRLEEAGISTRLLKGEKPIPALQFTLFRIVFGVYLTVHFAALLPYGAEIYSNAGLLPDANANPTFMLFPSVFWFSDAPAAVTSLLALMVVAALCFTLGFYRRIAAFTMWFGWAMLFNRNVLTSNPSLAYVGLALMLTLLVPPAEPLTFRRRTEWQFPRMVYECGWWLLALGYTFSGLVKLQSPSWVDGSALLHLMNNPLARPSALRDLFLTFPPIVLQLLTWGALIGEIAYLFLSFHWRTRLLAWLSMIGLHLGILVFVDFADLTLGMLMFHLFLFDPRWLPARADGRERIVFYDGDCGLCQRSIQQLLELDTQGVLKFAPLQGETAARELPESLRRQLDTLAYKGGDGVVRVRSDAVLFALCDVGGVGRIVGSLRIVPRSVRDAVYRVVAANRHRVPTTACRLPTPEERARMVG